MHIQKSVYLLKDSSFQRFHLHLLLPQAGVERNSLGGGLGTDLRYLLVRSVLKVVKERKILNEEMRAYCEGMNNQNEVLLIQFLLSVHFERLISLLLLFDPHQVILCTLLQHVLILDSLVEDDVNITWGEKLVFITSTKAPLTFLKPSRTPFMFSYLLKRSAKERSTELRSATAWSLSAVNCLTDLLQDRLFCCCSSSAERKKDKS